MEVGAGLELPEPQQAGRAPPVPLALRSPAEGPLGSWLPVFLLPLTSWRGRRGPTLTLAHPLGACCPGLPEGGLAAAQECTLASWLSNVTEV